jgi:hypothetical protein
MSDAPYKPLPMRHPMFQPAQKGVSADRRRGTPATRGHAARFPPMTANSAADEEFLRARGYMPNPGGRLPKMMVDGPAAIEREGEDGAIEMIPLAPPAAQVVEAPPEYPRYVGQVRVNSAEEHRALLEAQGAPPLPPAPAAPPARQTATDAQPPQAGAPVEPTPLSDVAALTKRVDILEKNTRQILAAVNSLIEAAKPKPPSKVEERDQLRREAKRLGLKMNGRQSAAQMRAQIAAARKQSKPEASP